MSEKELAFDDFEKGRGQQFMKLYMACQRRLYGFVISLVPNWSDVDDIVQETTSVMWAKFDEFKPGTDFSAWALAIARYQVMSYRQRTKVKRRRFSDRTIEAISDIAVSTNQQEQDRRDALRKCLDKLKEKDRGILKLRYEVDASIKSVADRIGLSVNTLYKNLSRIHIQLFNCVNRTMLQEGR